MKAIRIHSFGPPEAMHLEEFPDLVPNPDQVVMTVKASGVNPVDTYIRPVCISLPWNFLIPRNSMQPGC